jgi:hypothetical protein
LLTVAPQVSHSHGSSNCLTPGADNRNAPSNKLDRQDSDLTMINANEAMQIGLEQFASTRAGGATAGALLRLGAVSTLVAEALTP